MKKILVAEDEAAIREFIVINLKRNGYEVTDAENGEKALEAYFAENGKFDIVLLDIMMPVVDGLEVCKRIRQDNSSIGIIMLTAKTQETDKVNGLIMGADDYVTKPFSPGELMARVDALHRRVCVQKGDTSSVIDSNEYILYNGDFVLNLKNRTLTRRGVLIELTQVEFQIMEYFLLHPGQPLDRNIILDHVWGSSYVGEEKVVDVNVRRLRMKIEDDPSTPRHLLTVWGMGYKWVN